MFSVFELFNCISNIIYTSDKCFSTSNLTVLEENLFNIRMSRDHVRKLARGIVRRSITRNPLLRQPYLEGYLDTAGSRRAGSPAHSVTFEDEVVNFPKVSDEDQTDAFPRPKRSFHGKQCGAEG